MRISLLIEKRVWMMIFMPLSLSAAPLTAVL